MKIDLGNKMNKFSGLMFGLIGMTATLPVSAGSEPTSAVMRLNNFAVARDAAMAGRFGSVLRRIQEADADAPRMRGAHETELFERTSPAVVLIFSLDGNDRQNGLGSGSVINAQGQILTNLHVVEGADRVAVVFKPRSGGINISDINRADLYTARVEKQDKARDLALLRLEHKPDALTTLEMGSLGGVSIGADVHAIGHPGGATWTYTKGIVSQIRVNAEWSYSDDRIKHHATVIQTQTPINPGNSGGPLINDAMQLVGVNTYSRSEAQGMNYAVSVDDVKAFIAEPAQAAPSPQARTQSVSGESQNAGDQAPNKPRPKQGGKTKNDNEDNTVELAPPDGKKGAGTHARTPSQAAHCEFRYGDRERDPAKKAWRTEVDYNCSGHFNAYMLDWDDNSRGKSLFIDRNGDGKVDALYEDKDGNGKAELAKFDTHQQGEFDVQVELDEATGEVVGSSVL